MRRYARRSQTGKKALGLAAALLGGGILIRQVPVFVWDGILLLLVLLLVLLLLRAR